MTGEERSGVGAFGAGEQAEDGKGDVVSNANQQSDGSDDCSESQNDDPAARPAASAKDLSNSRVRPSDPVKAPLWILFLGLAIVFGVGSVKPFIPHAPEGSTAHYWNEVLPLFVAELGVACLVAYIIGWAIDAQAKRREQRAREEREEQERQRRAFEKREAEIRDEREREELRDREQRLTQDVFRGVLGIQHSSAYVRKVIESTLDRKIIRRTVTIMYKLTRLTKDEATELGIEHPEKFIFLDQAVTFEFENLSSEELPIPVKFAVPARHGTRLREASRVLSAVIDGKEQDVERALQEDSHGDAKIYVWKHRIKPHGYLPVAVKARVIKEDSDSEVWSSYFPCTEGMSLQVTAPPDLHMGMRNNTASQELEEIPQGRNGMAIWKISGPILPNNSVVFYWRTPEHDGDASVSTSTSSRRRPRKSPGGRGEKAPPSRAKRSARRVTEE